MNLCVEMVLYVKDHFSIDLSQQSPGVQWFTLLWTAVSVYIGLCIKSSVSVILLKEIWSYSKGVITEYIFN